MTPDKILQVGLGFWASKTLLSAIEMELFTELAKASRRPEDITGGLGLHPRSAYDFSARLSHSASWVALMVNITIRPRQTYFRIKTSRVT